MFRPTVYSAEEVRAMIRETTQRCGVNWLANKLYLSPNMIWYCMNGKRSPSLVILNYLGLEKMVVYRQKDTGI
jgi:hypothetical protein